MPDTDFAAHVLAAYSNAIHFMIDSPNPLGEWVVVDLPEERKLSMFLATEVDAEHAHVPEEHRAAIAHEVAQPRRDDELLVFEVRGGVLKAARLDRARIDRDLPPRFVFDVRNHLPTPWPAGWRGPFALHLARTYKIDTPDCQVIARILDDWDRDEKRERSMLEIGVTQAMDPVPPSDAQVQAILAQMRACGPWAETTHQHARRHPSRRIFSAEVGSHPEAVGWREVQPEEETFGPPPGWEPVKAFDVRPLVFRIEGSGLHVEWSPPAGVAFFEAATGRIRERSRFALRAEGRRPTDEEVALVAAMLGGARFDEVKGPGAKRGRNERVFLSTAGWLRRPAGRG
jgi:hypothetical protein